MKKSSQAFSNHKLITARFQRHLSQQEVADLIGTTRVNVSRWECGVTCPSPYFRQQLCTLFEKNAEELGIIPKDAAEGSKTLIPSRQEGVSSGNHVLHHISIKRNLFFTGREDTLTSIHAALHSKQPAALTQTCIINGSGGVGKTQMVVEYIYRHYEDYQVILWIQATSCQSLVADLSEIAVLLGLIPGGDALQPQQIIKAVRHWLQEQERWLLVMDNICDLNILNDTLFATHNGHILLTTRNQVSGILAQHITLAPMTLEEGAFFLMRRSKRIDLDTPLEGAAETLRIHAREISRLMGGLPLALDQAGAYIETMACDLPDYIDRYQAQPAPMLSLRENTGIDHPESVATMLSCTVSEVAQANSAALDLLRLCAFFAPVAIPEEIITGNGSELGLSLQSIVSNPPIFDAALVELRKHSLLSRNPEARTLTMHGLVQTILKESLDEDTRRLWAMRAIKAMSRTLLANPSMTKQQYQRYLPHVQACAELAQQLDIVIAEGAELLYSIALYSDRLEDYSKAEAFCYRAVRISEKLVGRNEQARGRIPSHLPTFPGQAGAKGRKSSLVGMRIVTSISIVGFIAALIILSLLLSTSHGFVWNRTANTSQAFSRELSQEELLYLQKQIGISDGNFVFDTYPGCIDVPLKVRAAQQIRSGNMNGAITLLTQAVKADPTDGEARIYNEDMQVLQSHAPYITIVLGLAIDSRATDLVRARAIMEAAYLEQHEVNTNRLLPNSLRLRILIDNSGSNISNVTTVTQFIANRVVGADNPDHIVAIVGWPFSSQVINARDIIAGIHLPMISQTASSVLLSGDNPYLFRVSPPDDQQGKALGNVAVKQLHVGTVLIIRDPNDPYSVSLANAFSDAVTAHNVNVISSPAGSFTEGGTTVEQYQLGAIHDAVTRHVDLIFMAGFDADAIRLAHALGNQFRANPTNSLLAHLQIMGGDAIATNMLLGQGNGPDAKIATSFPQDMHRLIFSSFAHPDEWAFEKVPVSKWPVLFSDWTATYSGLSARGTPVASLSDHAILTYDALQLIIKATTLVHGPLTGDALRNALVSFGKGAAFQGASGRIAFDDKGNPVDKALVLLAVENVNGNNVLKLNEVIGPFF
jgi:ABC-type branched-subunit amino acid transport system substrate-binding protein/transcriptional regulator with XRE-family HTH domain